MKPPPRRWRGHCGCAADGAFVLETVDYGTPYRLLSATTESEARKMILGYVASLPTAGQVCLRSIAQLQFRAHDCRRGAADVQLANESAPERLLAQNSYLRRATALTKNSKRPVPGHTAAG